MPRAYDAEAVVRTTALTWIDEGNRRTPATGGRARRVSHRVGPTPAQSADARRSERPADDRRGGRGGDPGYRLGDGDDDRQGDAGAGVPAARGSERAARQAAGGRPGA